MSESTPAAGGLRSRVVRGLAWKATSQIVMQLSRVVVAIVLARLLTPFDYGLAGMVLVFASLVLAFSDLGLGAALVQRASLTQVDRSTIFWTSVFAGAGFTLVGIAAAGPLSDFYREPEVKPLFIALSFSFFITSLGITHSALLTREMSWRALETCWMTGSLAGAAVGIAVALAGKGAWAIIAQQVTTAAVTTALLWFMSPWRPGLAFSRASLRDLGGFGANVFGQRFLYYLHRNTDNLLIGRYLGAAPLGAYAIAYNVMLVPFSRIAGPIQEVLFPAFARLQHDAAKVASIWLRATRLVASISMPALLGLVVVAPDFVTVVLGDRWDAAIPVLQILAWVGLLQSLQTLNGDILMALDKTSTLLRYSIFFYVGNLIGFVIGLQWGIVGVAAGYAISSTVIEPFFTWLTARSLGMSLGTYLRGLSGVAQAALLMLAAVLAARLLLLETEISTLVRLLLLIGLGAAVYLPCLAWRAPEVRTDLRSLLGRNRDAAAG